MRDIYIPIASNSHKPPAIHEESASAIPDPRNVQKLESIIENLGNAKTSVVQNGPPGRTVVPGGTVDDGPGIDGVPISSGREFGLGTAPLDPPKPPDPPKSQPKQPDVVKPLHLASTVLQGKAIEKVVPVYPALAKQIRLAGEVSVEVIISPEGRVESVRVVSGQALFVKTAQDAARSWRFEPTILNGVPVRVTGVITFVFKLND
jgi:protein TonB